MLKNQLYAIPLDNYAIPAFVSGYLYYVGTLESINNFLKKRIDNDIDIKNSLEYLNKIKKFQKEQLIENVNVSMIDLPIIKNVEIIKIIGFSYPNQFEWRHNNIWNFLYKMRCDDYKVEWIWVKIDDKFYRYIKCCFHNLFYSDEFFNTWKPLNSVFWGQPCLVAYNEKNGTTYSELYIPDIILDDYNAVLNDVNSFNFKTAKFDNFCNEIFGDG